MGRRALPLIVVTAAVLAAAPGVPQAATRSRPSAARLKAFTSCAALVSYARRNLRRTGGRVWSGVVDAPLGGPARGAPETVAAPQSEPGSAGTDYSTTNNQEEGVDEPDIVKTDGRRIYAMSGRTLYALDARAPRLLGKLELGDGYGYELLVRGDRVLALWRASSPLPVEGAPPLRSSLAPIASPGTTHIADIDVSNPAAMRIARSETVDGDYVTARRNGATARVVISSSPHVLIEPAAAARVSGWLPRAVVAARGRRSVRRAVACRAVRRPLAFSGLGMLTVLTIDLDRGLPAIDSDALMTDAQTVYGSTKSLYVATQRWIDPRTAPDRIPEGVRTAIHRFDASNAERTDYRASGEAPGYLLNQFSLSEFRGVLRVATTQEPIWASGQRAQDSESLVTVLDQHGARLDEVGRVGGLGRGERIYSVRFIEDAGYVVTFRQIDPLYTLDVSDATRPRVRGALELLGYSAYLHPVGRDLIFGVGRDASPEGRVGGAKLSLFDVSNLAAPKLLSRHALGSSSSTDAEFDHKAFLFWPPFHLAFLPVQIYGDGRASSGPEFTGAIGFRVARAGGIGEAGRVVHDRAGSAVPVTRSLVVGPRLFTLSDGGVLASDLSTLAPRTWVAFPDAPARQPGPEPTPTTAAQ
jgi:Beta propeller domain